MASALNNANSGIHQLPSNCYPPSESDDEDSFVVLNNSLGPDVYTDRILLNTEPISTQTIQASLDSIADILTQHTAQASPIREMQNSAVMDSTNSSYQSSDISADEIQKKVDNLIGENFKLKETLAQNNIAMKKQVETMTQWQKEVQRVQESHKEKFSDTKQYIAMLKAEIVQLKDKLAGDFLEEDSKKIKQIVVKQSENIKQFELEAAQKKIKELEKALDILSLEKEDLSKKMSEKEQELTNITADKELLLYELDLSKKREIKQNATANEIKMYKEEIVVLRDCQNNLEDEILQLQSHNDALKSDIIERERERNDIRSVLAGCEQDLSKTKQQLMASQMHITELKESHLRKISESDKKIESLQSQIKEFHVDVNENAALRAQLELYKSDFELEKAQRKELVDENNKIADNLQQLQRRNNQLHEEIDQLKSDFVHVKRDEVRAAPSESPPPLRHICPICSSKFASVRLLEDHVGYCLAHAET